MTSLARVVIAVLLVVVACLAAPPPMAAQDLPGWNPEFGTPSMERRVSVGVDVGKPLVFGATAGYNFTTRISTNLGFAALGDFTALTGELRLNITHFSVATPIPFIAAGFTQYYLADGAEETSPITAHGAIGAEYMFLNFVGASVRLGYLEALGGSKNPSVDRYGISDDVSTFYFTMSGRYMF